MTTRILTITAASLAVVFSSCRPVGDPPKKPNPPVKKVTLEEAAKKEAEEARMKAEEELKKNPEVVPPGNQTPPVIDPPTPPQPTPPRNEYPFANKVPGKDGFVFSPYNNKVVDVRGMPSGMLVGDPTYPPADKKFFRVP